MKVALRAAPRMPLLVAWPPSSDRRLIDAWAEAVQAGADALTRRQ